MASDSEIFSSTIIPTIGRATLAAAVASVLEQPFAAAATEVIVVNDSGRPLPAAAWMESPRVRVITTMKRERSVARNTGAAIARGRYLHFLDDDDVLLPGAVQAIYDTAARDAAAGWIFGSWETVDNNGAVVDRFDPDLNGNIFALLISGEGLPLQGSFIRADHFFAVGGFDADPDLTGVEDRDLGRRMALTGTIAHAAPFVTRIRIGEATSTTDWSRTAERDRWGREKALRLAGVVARAQASATSSYWRGRATRAFVASSQWNLQRGQWLTAMSRLASAVRVAGGFPATGGFWTGLRTKIR